MTDAEKKVLDEEVVVESVDVEVGTMEDVDAIMKKFDRESNTRVWEGTPKKILRYVLAAFMLHHRESGHRSRCRLCDPVHILYLPREEGQCKAQLHAVV